MDFLVCQDDIYKQHLEPAYRHYHPRRFWASFAPRNTAKP